MKKIPFLMPALSAIILSGTCLNMPSFDARAATQQSQTEVVIDAVTGEGMNMEAARADAFRNAIAQAVGVFVRSDTVVEDYVTKSDKIRTSSRGFIKTFHQLNESTASDGVITVVLKVVVSTEALQEDLKSVVGHEFRNVGHPRVAVVGWFKGRDRSESEVNSIAVAALNRALIQRGYKVVDPFEIDRLRKEDSSLVQASGAVQQDTFDQMAQLIANRLKADIYVTTFGSVGQGKASVATKMYNSYTGQIFGSETGYGTVRGQSLSDAKKAVDDAITSSMSTVLGQVSNHWQDVLTNGQEFIIVFDGYTDGKQRRIFKQLLSEASGVSNVKQLMAGGTHAEFSVFAHAEPIDLFDEIVELAESKGMAFVNDEPVMRGGRALFILRK